MRKAVVAVLTIGLLSGGSVEAKSLEDCKFNSLDKGKWTTYEVKRTIRCMANRFGVSTDTAFAVAWNESRFNELAFNYGGCGGPGCGGLFQHHMGYWPQRADAYPKWQRWMDIRSDCWRNPRINTLVTMKMVQSNGWSPWGR